ncbi:MAG: hypothetical protein VX740_07745 [Pseudomonadota bacterium]|nr:hypothetical protein [Pseudomonadota bacterium]
MEQFFERAFIFAVLTVLVSIIRYGTYFISIFKRETRPHLFSWVNWGLIISIGAYAQLKLGGDFSAYMLLFVGLTCWFVAFLALFYGEKDIKRSDWVAFLAGLALIPVWVVTKDPVLTLILIICIDILTFYPTVRKTYVDPSSEPPVSYFWAGMRYFFILLTVPEFSFTVLFYPLFLMVTEWGFMAFIFWRRRIVYLAPKPHDHNAPIEEKMP